MILTGKNKEQFKKWYKGLKRIKRTPIRFEVLPFSMQSGVYLEYLDSVGYVVLIDKVGDTWEVFLLTNKRELLLDTKTTRQEALKEAFKKADELINNK